jgi:L-alanine-DL-glutamate epimerase-like enolase superfamily enzyme
MGAALLIDAGTVWEEDVEKAAARLEALESAGVLWLEEPFVSGALPAYRALAQRSERIRLAGGEGAHQFHMARNLIDYGAVGFIQIDTGRIGGMTTAKRVAEYAQGHGVTYVNHTFTSHLALSASLQPYAGLSDHEICEFPVESTSLALELTTSRIEVDAYGCLSVPEAPGLGMQQDLKTLKRYLVETEIRTGGRTLCRTPEVEI